MFLCSKITADSSYCSHEIERCLLFGRIAMTNLDSLLKSRDSILPTKIQLAKAVVFPVVKYEYESWTIKKLSTKELMFWTVVGEDSWEFLGQQADQASQYYRKSSPEYTLEGLMLKLKLQYFVHLMQELTHWKRPRGLERMKAGRPGDDRGEDDWMVSPTWWTWVWASSGSWWRTGKPVMLQSMWVPKSRTWLSDWTKLNETCRK